MRPQVGVGVGMGWGQDGKRTRALHPTELKVEGGRASAPCGHGVPSPQPSHAGHAPKAEAGGGGGPRVGGVAGVAAAASTCTCSPAPGAAAAGPGARRSAPSARPARASPGRPSEDPLRVGGRWPPPAVSTVTGGGWGEVGGAGEGEGRPRLKLIS